MAFENKGSTGEEVILSVEPDRSGNFVASGTNDHVDYQDALDYLASLEDGYELLIKRGVYDIAGTVTYPATDRVLTRGQGTPAINTSPTTTGGTILNCSDDAQITSAANARLTFQNLGFNFTGTYTDSCIDLLDNNYVNSFGCYYRVNCVVPTGNAGNAMSTPAGISIAIGRTGGPVGVPFVWNWNRFVDVRLGTNAFNTFLGMGIESLVFEGNYMHVNHAAGLVTPTMFSIHPVSYANMKNLAMFIDVAYGGQYERQIATSGANKNFRIENFQFLDAAELSGTHFYTNSGDMYVYGHNPQAREGGTTPVALTAGGAGTVHQLFTGRGYEDFGLAVILNGNASVVVAHDLVGDPSTNGFITITGAENSAEVTDLLVHTIGAANFTIERPAGNVSADRDVFWKARYALIG